MDGLFIIYVGLLVSAYSWRFPDVCPNQSLTRKYDVSCFQPMGSCHPSLSGFKSQSVVRSWPVEEKHRSKTGQHSAGQGTFHTNTRLQLCDTRCGVIWSLAQLSNSQDQPTGTWYHCQPVGIKGLGLSKNFS